MLANKDAVATVAVKDLKAAKKFYEEIGLQSTGEESDMTVTFKTGKSSLLVYKSDYAGTNKATSVTWGVGDDFDEIVKSLESKGVEFERYDDLPGTKREGVVHKTSEMGGVKLAWFKDPEGNIHHLISL